MQHFDLTSFHRDEGFTTMAELGIRNSIPYEVVPMTPTASMTFTLARQSLRTIAVSRVGAGNYCGVRSEELAGRSSEPRLVLQAPEAPVLTEQGGHRLLGTQGSLVAMWSLSALRTEIHGPARLNAIDLPLADLGLPHRMLRELMGRDLGASPMGRIVTAYLGELARTELDDAGRDAAALPTVDLVRAMLTLASGDGSRARGPLRRTIGTRILLHLRAHLADPDLTADTVAARFSISRRYLYVILNAMGISLGEWIRTERLRAAATALQDPLQREIPVSAVARQVGFTDHSTFSRAFRAEYGCSPSAWREGVGPAS